MEIIQSTQSKLPEISIPVSLSQIAEGLRKLSKKDLETLELLLDKKAIRAIRQSAAESKRGKLKEL